MQKVFVTLWVGGLMLGGCSEPAAPVPLAAPKAPVAPAAPVDAAPAVPVMEARVAPAPAADPRQAEAIIQDFYAPYLKGGLGPDLLKSGKLTKSLLALWEADVKKAAAAGEIGAVEFDVITNGQDGAIADVKLTSSASGSGLVVTASFLLEGTPMKVQWDLVQEDGTWKVDNIRPGEQNLRKLLGGS